MSANARNFVAASTQNVRCSLLGVGNFATTTFAVVLRLGDLTNTKCICGFGTDPNSYGFYLDLNEQIGMWNGAASSLSPVMTLNTTDWFLFAVTKASGTQIPRAHVYNYTTGVWQHQPFAGALANGGNPATSAWIGADVAGNSPMFNGDIQAVALFGANNMSDATVETLAMGVPAWLQQTPAQLWMLNQSLTTQSVVDIVGRSTQVGLAGTPACVPGNLNFAEGSAYTPKAMPRA